MFSSNRKFDPMPKPKPNAKPTGPTPTPNDLMLLLSYPKRKTMESENDVTSVWQMETNENLWSLDFTINM
jgi:hypothetical protein